jgi:hypothetical protein
MYFERLKFETIAQQGINYNNVYLFINLFRRKIETYLIFMLYLCEILRTHK